MGLDSNHHRLERMGRLVRRAGAVFSRNLRGSGLGFRVPMLIVSPYSKRNHTSHTPYASEVY